MKGPNQHTVAVETDIARPDDVQSSLAIRLQCLGAAFANRVRDQVSTVADVRRSGLNGNEAQCRMLSYMALLSVMHFRLR